MAGPEDTQLRFEVFTAVTIKNAVFWDVGLVKSDVSEELFSIFRDASEEKC
jgi:hypothetical protein